MSKIEFRPQDLLITESKSGDKVVNIKGSLAFDNDFIEEMRANGVKEFVPDEEEETEEEEES